MRFKVQRFLAKYLPTLLLVVAATPKIKLTEHECQIRSFSICNHLRYLHYVANRKYVKTAKVLKYETKVVL